MPIGIDAIAFNPQDKIVENDAASNPHNYPQMFVASVDLNTELEKGLKAALQQANCMFNADANL
jgi:hypothetical protein